MTTTESSAPHTEVVEGKRLGQLIRVKPEYQERYVVLHAHPFPELIEQMRASNQHNYSIFLRDDLLFSFFEYVGSNFETDMKRLADTQIARDWWTLTDPMQEPLSDRGSDEWWASMDELYHGGPKSIPSRKAEKRAFFSRVRDGGAEELRRTYDAAGAALDSAIEAVPLQNYSVYLLGDRLCTYVEGTGSDVAAALDRLRKSEAMQALDRTLDSLLVDLASSSGESRRRQAMKSVFYMA